MTTTTQVAQVSRPTVYFTPEAWNMMMGYVRACDIEISGYGVVDILPNNRGFLVKDIFIVPQTCAAASTEFDTDGTSQLIANKMMSMSTEEADAWNSSLRLWWHSHVNMGCHWSTTDQEQMASFQNDWNIAIVLNKRGDFLCRFDDYHPVHIVMDNCDVKVDAPLTTDQVAKIEEDIKSMVKGRTYAGTNNWNKPTPTYTTPAVQTPSASAGAVITQPYYDGE